MKLLHIIGARPQFIKYFPIQQAIRKTEANYSIENLVIHTGQHYDYCMSKIFFDELGIDEPDYHLEVGSGAHGQQTGLVMQRVENVLFKEQPDIMIVYGDTKFYAWRRLSRGQDAHPRGPCGSGSPEFQQAYAGRDQPDFDGSCFGVFVLPLGNSRREPAP